MIPRKLVVNHNYHEMRSTTWIKVNQLQPAEKSLFPEKSVRVLTEAKTVNVDHIIFCLAVACLLYRGTMVAKKLLVSDKVTACYM